MNKERFTELLNLYLDDEISSDDLSDLMAETRDCPNRQELFLDYCRIHKACGLMGHSVGSRRSKRSLKQVAYALGGLAAAFALLGMAGRNLLPLLNGPTANPAIVQSGTSSGGTLFFPEIATSDGSSTGFFRVNRQADIEYAGVSNFGNLESEGLSKWNERLVLNPSKGTLDLKTEALFAEDVLDFGALDLQDPFNAFDEMSAAAPLSFSKAAFAPSDAFELSFAQDSRLNLK